MAESLEEQRWTVEELEAARKKIFADPEISKIADYKGAVTIRLFAVARQAIRPVVASRGACYRCGRPKVMTMNGKAYCDEHADEL